MGQTKNRRLAAVLYMLGSPYLLSFIFFGAADYPFARGLPSYSPSPYLYLLYYASWDRLRSLCPVRPLG